METDPEDKSEHSGATAHDGSVTATPAPGPVPREFLEITSSTLSGIDRALGYFGKEPYVVFAYQGRGEEVIWKDGQSCGFAHGAWETMIARLGSVARQRGVDLGGETRDGSHVLFVDRARGRAFFAEHLAVERFLSDMYGESRGRCIDPARQARRELQSRDECDST